MRVDDDFGRFRNGEDLIVEDGYVVIGASRAYCVENLEQRRPRLGIMWWWRRGSE